MDKHLQLKDGEEFLWKERLPLYSNLTTFFWSIVVIVLLSLPIRIFMEVVLTEYIDNPSPKHLQIFGIIYYSILGLLFLNLAWTVLSSKSVISMMTTQRIITREGVLMIEEDTVELFQVVDTKLKETLFDRMLGRGSVILFTPGDASNTEVTLRLIRSPREKMESIRKLAEAERNRLDIKIAELQLNNPKGVVM